MEPYLIDSPMADRSLMFNHLEHYSMKFNQASVGGTLGGKKELEEEAVMTSKMVEATHQTCV